MRYVRQRDRLNRCPVCDNRASDATLTPDNEQELLCPHCGSVHVLREGLWVYVRSLYPWRSQLLLT